MNDKPDKSIWKSYVWYGEKCYFVSTIGRSYDTYIGSTRGQETIVWEYNWNTAERGELLWQAAGVKDHQNICRCLIAEGLFPDENDPRTERFCK